MKDLILKNWNVIRFLRLGIGIAILVQAIVAQDILFGLVGLLFAGMAILNAGCCGASCAIPTNKTSETNDITYKEVK